MFAAVIEVCGSHGYLDKTSLARCETTCGHQLRLEEAWRCEAKRLWGSGIDLGRTFSTWRELLQYCETTTTRMLAQDVSKALRELTVRCGAFVSGDDDLPVPKDRAECLFAIASRAERCGSWIARRVVANFVTSSVDGFEQTKGHHESTLASFVELLGPRLAASESAEEALREALLFFPFLPAKTSQGADRVIDALARAYVASTGDDHDVTYVLWYSLILLNTDLHSRCVTAKITEDGFVRSLSRVTSISLDDDDLFARLLYRSIKRKPLVADHQQRSSHNQNDDAWLIKRDQLATDYAYAQIGRVRPSPAESTFLSPLAGRTSGRWAISSSLRRLFDRRTISTNSLLKVACFLFIAYMFS